MAAGQFFRERVAKFERRCLIKILKKTNGNVRQAAKMIDERRSRLYRMMIRHGLKADDFRGNTANGGRTSAGTGVET